MGLRLVRAIVRSFEARGVGAVVMKALPLQYVDGASSTWTQEMGERIGTRTWFLEDPLDPDRNAYSKVANHWRRLGWRELATAGQLGPDAREQPTFLLELLP